MNLAQQLNIKSKFETQHIIDSLEKNLAAHKEDFKKATEVYEKDIMNALMVLSDKIKTTVVDYDYTYKEVSQAYSNLNRIVKPIDAQKMYEQYISLFKSSADETIELTFVDANCIFNDSWDWAVSAKTINSLYSSRF